MAAVGTRLQGPGFLQGGGDAGARIRAVDWSRTPLGAPDAWPTGLRTAVRILLDSLHPMWLAWGEDLPLLYNDACVPLLGDRHPRAMGRPARDAWAGLGLGAFVEGSLPTVLAGEATRDEGLLLFLERDGFREETYHAFSCSPLRDDGGDVRGLLCVVSEETGQHVAARHAAVLRELAARLDGARTAEAVVATAVQALSTDPLDLPYLAIYRVDAGAGVARRVAGGRVADANPALPVEVRLDDDRGWPIGRCVRDRRQVQVDDLAARVGHPHDGNGQPAPRQGVVVPIDIGDDGAPTAVLVAALSPHRAFDAGYRGLLELAARQIGGAMGIARRHEDAQRRADALAELERAKTAALERELALERERVDVLETIGDAFIALGADWSVRYVNASLERTVDGTRARIVGLSHWEAFPADAEDVAYAEILRTVMRTRRPQRVEHYYAPVDRWFEVDMMPSSDGGLHIYGRDITARRARFDALRESERLLRETAEQAPAMLWITDTGGQCTFLSRAWYAYTGQSEAEGLGLGWLDAVHPGHREAAGEAFLQANARQEPFTLEHPLRTAAGEYRWVIDAGQPRFDANGHFAGYIGSVMDVHESRVAREELERTEQRLRAATAAANLGTWRVDLRTGLETRDAGLNAILGLPSEETTQPLHDFIDRVHPDDRARVEAGVQAAIEQQVTYDLECRIVRPDGEVRWLRDRGGVVLDGAGDVAALTGAASDVTAQRAAAAALAESEARYRSLFESMHEGFCIIEVRYDEEGVGVDYRFVETNPSFVRQVGLRDAVGRWVTELVPGIEPHWPRAFGEVARSRRAVRFEERSDVLQVNFEINAFPVGRAEQHRVAVLFNDITQRTLDEQALRDADRRKDEFLATLAHELRNPLAPISSALQLLEADIDPSMAAHLHAIMRRQTLQLTRLVDDLMEVSRITRGHIDLQVEPVDVRDTVRDALDASAEAIRASGHEVQVDLPGEALVMQADTVRLSQVFTNLINNAARHTDPGGRVRVRAWRCEGAICVSVADTGHGIRPDDHARIFELFTRVAPAGASRGGLGIGLRLARRLVEMHGGTIEVESEGAGRGSTFAVRLPAIAGADAIAPAASTQASGPLSGLRVVVADDNHDAAATLAMWLQMQGAQATQAHDGMAALEAIALADAHVALLDLGMPRGGGIEVARQLRARGDVRQPLLVAVTGWGQAVDRERTREAGFDHHMTKPADLDALHALLAPVAAKANIAP